MTGDAIYLVVGAALLLAVVLPAVLQRHAVSAPMVLLVVGMLIGLLPLPGVGDGPMQHREALEHLTELTVIVALMGVGLALDRPLELLHPRTWLRWGAAWRMLAIAMPLCIAGVALLGWSLMGLAPAAALLLGAALAPTDPVLASDVQVEGPSTSDVTDEAVDELDEDDEVRFALTAEAGLNDGLAFPFVYAAIFMVSMGDVGDWAWRWFAWEVVGMVAIGVVTGTAVGWLLAKLAFRAPRPSLRLAETGEPLLALAGVLLSYGVAEVAHGYGFLAVFACGMTLRLAERGHDYHAHMHGVIERLERLLTLLILLLLGSALTNDLIGDLTWQGAVVAVLLILVVRPLSGLVALRIGWGKDQMGSRPLTHGEEAAVAWFGVRGIGSLFYLAYASGQADFPGIHQLWATVGCAVALSVLVHGVTATPIMQRLDARKEDRLRGNVGGRS